MRALPARAAAAGARSWPRRQHRRRSADRGRDRRSRGRRSATALSAELYGCQVLLEPASRTRPRTRPASSGWHGDPARDPPTPRRRSPGRRRSSSGACPTRPARWSTCCRSSPTARSTSARSSPGRCKQGLGRYMFFADLEGTLDDADVAAALERSARRSRRCACSAPTRLPASREPAPSHWLHFPAIGWNRIAGDSGLHGHRARRRGLCPGLSQPAGNGSAPRRRATLDSGRVLVLNASYEPLNVCTVRRAVVLVLKEKAEMLETGRARALHSESITLPHPVVIRLVTYVRVPRDQRRRRHHPARRVRARLVDLPVLRHDLAPDRRPRDPAQPRRAPATGRTSSPPVRPATAARATARRSRPACTRAASRSAPGPTMFIRVAAPVVPPAWQQYLVYRPRRCRRSCSAARPGALGLASGGSPIRRRRRSSADSPFSSTRRRAELGVALHHQRDRADGVVAAQVHDLARPGWSGPSSRCRARSCAAPSRSAR